MADAPIPIIADDREKKIWNLDPARFSVVRKRLTTGDYTIMGLEDRVAIERKELGDAVNTFIHGWINFRKELYRLAAMDHAIIIVEANVEDILAHRYESEANPMSVMGRAAECYIDHGVAVLWAGHRPGCIPIVEQHLRLVYSRCKP